MAQALVVILFKPEQLPTLLKAWDEIGVQGATILRSVGGYRAKTWLDEVGLGALQNLFDNESVRTKTILSVFDNDAQLEQAIVAAEQAIGSFKRENAGILFTLPVGYVEGLRHDTAQAETPPTEPALYTAELVTRQMLIKNVHATIDSPVVVSTNQTLLEVAEAVAGHPGMTIACVVNQRNRLVGLISLRQLLDDLFMAVVPEEFLAESISFDKVMNFAKLDQTQTAGDAMVAPVWVTEDDTVKDAFVRMHEHQLAAIPVVDDQQEVVGCISRIDLLLLYAKHQKRARGE